MRFVRRTRETGKSTDRMQSLVISLAINPAFRRDVAPETCYVAESVSGRSCIKRIELCANQQIFYAATGGKKVHALLCLPKPNWYDNDELCVVESRNVSRQVGVIIRHEALFTLTKLEVCLKDEKLSFKRVEDISSAEFYRCENMLLDTELMAVSLCRSGSHIICATSGSHRVNVYKNKYSEKLQSARVQRFDAPIVDMSAVDSGTERLIVIAFRDNSIRLYRHHIDISTYRNNYSVLQEIFRVECECVHKILWTGDRLLVAQRAEDEESDRFSSCRLINERLIEEFRVQTDEELAIECWISSDNWIVAANRKSSDLMTFKYSYRCLLSSAKTVHAFYHYKLLLFINYILDDL